MTGKAQIKNNLINRLSNNTARISTNFNSTRNVNKNSPSIPITGAGVNGSMNSNLIMNSKDIVEVDKIIFGTVPGAGSDFTSTESGISSIFFGDIPLGIEIKIPATVNNEIFRIKRGTNEIINISALGTIINGDVYLGSSLTSKISIVGKIGFYGATTISKPTITGSKAGNAALTSLLSALSSFGLITNSTT